MTDKQKKNQQPLTGKVVSAKMNKTVVVAIADTVKSPEYKKYLKRTRKLMAHDENGQCKLDDMVLISQARPYSKNKAWKVEKVLS